MSEPSVTVTRYTKNNDGYEPEAVVVTANLKTEATPAETGDGEQREGWGNKFEFILAIIGYAVGLGNVWRFPYLVQKNGGGAFIIPYVIALVTMGVPLFFLELAIGQRLRKGPLQVWRSLSPYFTGIGFCSVIVSFLVGVYYNMVVAWCLYYLAISFRDPPHYAECPTIGNTTQEVVECKAAGSTQYYWYRQALQATSTIEDGGGINWLMVVALLVAWIIVFLITCKGVESMGKAVYFTAIFPYVVLIIFFIQGMTLPGMSDGVKKMFTPDFAKLADPEVWLEASTQIFYSLGLGFGGLIAMASYNDINNNIVRDAVMVSCINCGTSIFAGIVIFSFLGHKAHTKFGQCNEAYKQVYNVSGRPIPTSVPLANCSLQTYLDQVSQGPGLTFIAFTDAISTMPVMPLWSFLFFAMLLTLGLGSMIGTLEGVRTSLIDLKIFPFRKEIVGAILCTFMFLIGLVFTQRSGEYWLQMFDSFAAPLGLLTIGLFEIIVIIYLYGLKRFSNDIFYMLGNSPNIYWKVTWVVITPLFTSIIMIASLYNLFANKVTYSSWNKEKVMNVTMHYPAWGEALCFILIILSVIAIPVCAALKFLGLWELKSDDDGSGEDGTQSAAGIAKSESRAVMTEHEQKGDLA